METTGCMGPSTCVPKGTHCPVSCPHVMPMTCSPTQMLCTSFDHYTGCAMQGWCMEMTGPDGCAHHCSPSCDYSTQDWCPGLMEGNCMGPDTCVPKGTPCPTKCGPPMLPITCGSTEQLCESYDHETGCPTASHCMPMTSPDGCAQYCPTSCAPTQQLCTPFDHMTGCPMHSYCTDMTYHDGCPAYCDTGCDYSTQDWCAGVTDSNGCWGPSTCVPKGSPCPASPK